MTAAACRWLLSGGTQGGYSGPFPRKDHQLAPLLSRETGIPEAGLAAAADWLRRETTLQPVLSLLEREGNSVFTFKGFDLARSVYPFPAGRPMADVDFILPRESLESVLSAFVRSGWTAGGSGLCMAGVTSELKLSRNSVTAELHTHVFFYPDLFPGRLPADLYDGGRVLGPGLRGLPWHNALLLVLLHMLANPRIRPVWWVDTALLCSRVRNERLWGRFWTSAAGTGLGPGIARLLTAIASGTGAPVPGTMIRALEGLDKKRMWVLRAFGAPRGVPTLMGLRQMNGWRRIAWLHLLFWTVVSGGSALDRRRRLWKGDL